MEAVRSVYKILVREPEGERDIPRHRWEDNIKVWLRMGSTALVNTVICL
jgi:hypothetical protein